MIPFPKPLKHGPALKVRRLPERKRMTIAVGLDALGGIVMAADTLELGYLKTSSSKFHIAARSDHGAIAISGAGTAGYLDAIAQEIQKVFHGMGMSTSLDDLETEL